MTVMSFCTSSFEGHLRISSSPDEKRSYLALPDQFSCEKGCSQFHQLGLVVQTAFVNCLSAKNLFKLQPEHWKQQMSLVTPTHHVRLLRATGSQLLNVERLMSSETCGFVSSGPLTTFSCSASKKSVHSHFFLKSSSSSRIRVCSSLLTLAQQPQSGEFIAVHSSSSGASFLKYGKQKRYEVGSSTLAYLFL